MMLQRLSRSWSSKNSCRRFLRSSTLSLNNVRTYSTSSTSMVTSLHQSQASMLAVISSDLDKIAPRFEIDPGDIQILQTPLDFYMTLKAKILKARRRVYLSTLYIGKSEHDLIATIRAALAENPNLRVSFLADALRGTRETPDATTASLLVPLISEFGSKRVEVRMFHTPNLTGLKKKYLPKRINEGWGLQHVKLYGIDDEIIVSGANLSSDYFTNRQDRYHLFRSKEITDYFAKIHSGIANLSFDIQPSNDPESGGYSMSWLPNSAVPSPLDHPTNFKDAAAKQLSHLLLPSNSPQRLPSSSVRSSTTVYPIFSLVPLLSSSTELPAITQILQRLSQPFFSPSTWVFTAGYFNTTPSFCRLLLSTRPATGTVLTAHPHANGFFGSNGISSMLPAAYTHLAKDFLRKARNHGLSDTIQLSEWRKGMVGQEGGWTYHAKGLWISFPTQRKGDTTDPSLTIVGSSNYTKRSYELDLEANVVIATSDPGLRRRLGEEVKWLSEYAQPVSLSDLEKPDRKVGWHVRLSMWVVRVLGGAL